MKKQDLLKYFDDYLLDKLFGFCYARTNDSYEAEELCSDIIYALVKAAHSDGEIESVYPFKDVFEKANAIYTEQLPKICETISNYIEEHKAEYLAFPYLNKKVDMNLILWQQEFHIADAFSYCVECALKKNHFADVEKTDRPFSVFGYVDNGKYYGGVWMALTRKTCADSLTFILIISTSHVLKNTLAADSMCLKTRRFNLRSVPLMVLILRCFLKKRRSTQQKLLSAAICIAMEICFILRFLKMRFLIETDYLISVMLCRMDISMPMLKLLQRRLQNLSKSLFPIIFSENGDWRITLRVCRFLTQLLNVLSKKAY